MSVASETMLEGRVPPNEAERLAAVRRYDILDTPPDGAFDRITAMAARLFKAPIAIVSIVDHDRIWFKSHHGLDVTEIGRDPGLCASAILQVDPYVLPDARRDPRALANPLVAGEFGLRFYAAAPLRTSDGFNLGTLCVIDKEPRPITAEHLAQLQDLAALVMDQMELRRSALASLASKDADVEALRRAEENQQLLLNEMDHRVKNLFAIVGGIVALTARTATTPRQLADAIQGRLGALASAHQLVRAGQASSDPDHRETTLADLIRTVLAPYVSSARIGDAARVVAEGPPVTIGGEAMTSFALVFHELATNAAKYGALSTAGGQVAISWSMGEGELLIVWRERGGPTVTAAPGHEGFGSQLARRSVHGQLGGQIAYDWDPSGLIVRLSVAADRLGA